LGQLVVSFLPTYVALVSKAPNRAKQDLRFNRLDVLRIGNSLVPWDVEGIRVSNSYTSSMLFDSFDDFSVYFSYCGYFLQGNMIFPLCHDWSQFKLEPIRNTLRDGIVFPLQNRVKDVQFFHKLSSLC
jgi:hypothetical protein